MAYLRSCPNIFRNTLKYLASSRSFTSSTSSQLVPSFSETLSSISQSPKDSPALEDAFMDFIFAKNDSAQALTRRVWSHIVKKGDTVIDATCGDGSDTLALLRMVADSTRRGCVYAMDVNRMALEKASELLDQHVTPEEKELVQMFNMCHSNLDYMVPANIPVRLVAFDLGSCHEDKAKKRTESTQLALKAAKTVLAPGGLITILLHVRQSSGREVFDTVQAFASGLPNGSWSCCKLEMFTRPKAPVLFLLVKR